MNIIAVVVGVADWKALSGGNEACSNVASGYEQRFFLKVKVIAKTKAKARVWATKRVEFCHVLARKSVK